MKRRYHLWLSVTFQKLSTASITKLSSTSCLKLTYSFWFGEYLRGRTQAVRVNNTLSNITQITFSVSQGFTLGPILFTIFVNDSSETINDCEVVQYADDIQFIPSGTLDSITHITQAQTTLTRALTYFNTNGQMLNSSKTQCLFVWH